MATIVELINEIKKRPPLFLQEPTVFYLKALLDGYAFRDMELSSSASADFLQGFQHYVEAHYDEKRTLSWASIIANNTSSPDGALETFFDLIHAYETGGSSND